MHSLLLLGTALLGAQAIPDLPGLPDLSGYQDVPTAAIIGGDSYSVKNNTALELVCSAKVGSSWGAWFPLRAGREWSGGDPFGDFLGGTMEFQCAPPVRQVRYRIASGKRYSLLGDADGEVGLFEIH